MLNTAQNEKGIYKTLTKEFEVTAGKSVCLYIWSGDDDDEENWKNFDC